MSEDIPPIIDALQRRRLAEMMYYLESGEDVNRRGEYGETALHWAAIFGLDDAARELVKRGADSKIVDANGQTPLQLAQKYGNRAIIKALTGASASRSR
jgi:ankyrin repeat protein